MDDERSSEDTIVVDEPGGWSMPTHFFPADEVLAVQIHGDDGAWHRVAIGGLETACGHPIDYRLGQAIRNMESYAGKLCEECFTAHELKRSQQINKASRP